MPLANDSLGVDLTNKELSQRWAGGCAERCKLWFDLRRMLTEPTAKKEWSKLKDCGWHKWLTEEGARVVNKQKLWEVTLWSELGWWRAT